MSRKKLIGKGAIAFKISMLLLVSMEMEFPPGSLAFSASCFDGAVQITPSRTRNNSLSSSFKYQFDPRDCWTGGLSSLPATVFSQIKSEIGFDENNMG